MALKTLHTLIKLHKRRVDVIRREMEALEEERRQLLDLAEKLKKEHAEEMERAASDPKIASFFGAYSRRVKERQSHIIEEVKRLDGAIDAKSEAIREEFSEQKKYEIARNLEKKRILEGDRRRQQVRFDEIGAQQYLGKQDNT